jgi:DNA polymerase I-like protein with 3'-5' exonuclease and polymerase domains
MPVPLAYGAAHTHRLGGTWKLNLQNLPRRSKLRSALTGPAVVVVDASQIEARIVAWICGQTDLVEQFARGEDVYAAFASDNFGRPIIKKENPNERFVGKVGILQLGFGAGWPKYQGSVKITSRQELGYEIALTDGEASKTVYTYRSRYARIPATWARLQHEGIPALADGTPFSIGPCVFEKEAILLPNGLRLHYHNLRYEAGEWVFTYGGILKRIYGGKLLENIVQALARIITMDAGIRIQSRSDAPEPLRLGLQAHDELVYVPRRADHAGVLQGILIEEMTRRPHWAPDLPLAAEADFGSNYGEAK